MKRIAFIGCSKRKKISPCQAKDLYQGELFKKSLRYCQQEKFDKIYILSAKYGLVSLSDIIQPYEKTLNTFTEDEKKNWSNKVKQQILEKNISGEFWFFCGSNYHKYFEGEKPLFGLSLGYQLNWFNRKLKKGFNL